MTVNPKAVAAEFKSAWGGKPVEEETVLSVISEVLDTKLRGWKLHDHLVDSYGLSDGAAQELIQLTRAARRADNVPMRSAADARIERILRTRDSNGRAKARKFR